MPTPKNHQYAGVQINSEQYKVALEQITLTNLQLQILQYQYNSLDRAVNASELAIYLNRKPSFINLQYGRLGRIIAEKLNYVSELPVSESRGKPELWACLSIGHFAGKRGFVWTMRPDLAQALEELGLVNAQIDTDELSLAHEVDVQYSLVEGTVKTVKVNVYERSGRARILCIEAHGLQCIVCGFDFEAFYGELGKNYIHVHHLVPISSIKEDYEIDPIHDLAPVCPNCHAMIHRRTPPYTIKEIKDLIQKQSKRLE